MTLNELIVIGRARGQLLNFGQTFKNVKLDTISSRYVCMSPSLPLHVFMCVGQSTIFVAFLGGCSSFLLAFFFFESVSCDSELAT